MLFVVEIMLYTLKDGMGAAFFDIMQNVSAPLHRANGLDIVWHGQSLESQQGYFLIRAFSDLETRTRMQASFYASDAWRSGPRGAIIDMIEASMCVVVPMSAAAIAAIRADGFALHAVCSA